MALSAMILLGGAWIGIPLLSAWKLVENNALAPRFVDYQPMMTVLIAMTTATITGIFVFMTFRIDRGTRLKAERVVKDLAKDTVDEVVTREVEEFRETTNGDPEEFRETTKGELGKFGRASEAELGKFGRASEAELGKVREKLDELTKPETIREAVRSQISEDELRAHVEAVLLADANGRVVAAYAEERAGAMDTKTIEALLLLLDQTVKHVAQCAKTKRKDDRRRRRAETRAAIVGWWRRN